MDVVYGHQHPTVFRQFQKCRNPKCCSVANTNDTGFVPCLQCFGAALYCSDTCMWEDRIEHSLECRQTLHAQDLRPHTLLADRKTQRNMHRPKGGAPELFWKLACDLSVDDKTNKVVCVPLDINPAVRLTPASPVRLLPRAQLAQAAKGSSAMRAAYEWYVKHVCDRRDELYLYIFIYPPDMAFAEVLAVPNNLDLTDEAAVPDGRLEHKVCTCACALHRCSDAPPPTN